MMVLQQAARLSPDGDVRFAALVHDLGKATTDRTLLPAHHGHEQRSVKLVRKISARMPVPGAYRDLALLVAEYHGHCHRAFELKASTLLRVLRKTDAIRRPARFEKFIIACEADARGRTGLEDKPYPQADFLRGALRAVAGIAPAELAGEGLSGAEIGMAIDRERLRVLEEYKASDQNQPPKK